MRRCHYIACVILLMAANGRAQFTDARSNLFAVEAFASECISSSWEKCVAIGVTPYSPSYFDYLFGKNYAKENEVKANIAAVIASTAPIRYCRVVSNQDGYISTNGLTGFLLTNKTDFCNYAGIGTNFFDDTPYFASQYPETSNGWWDIYRALTSLSRIAGYEGVNMHTSIIVRQMGGSDVDWDTAYLDAWTGDPVLFTNTSPNSVEANIEASWNVYSPAYQMTIWREQAQIFFPLQYRTLTNFDSSATIYMITTAGSSHNVGFPAYFDSQLNPVSTNYLSVTNLARLRGYWLDGVYTVFANEVQPQHYDKVSTINTNLGYGIGIYEGWELKNNSSYYIIVHDFTASGLANGFKYKSN